MTVEPTLEQLTLYAMNRLELDMKTQVESHLKKGCAECDEQLRWIRSLLHSIREGRLEAAPAVMEHLGRRMFADHRRCLQERDPARLHAALKYDSDWIPLPRGVRAPVPGHHRLVFRAEPFDVDVELRRGHRGSYDLTGHLMSTGTGVLAGTAKILKRSSRQVEIDRRGLFTFYGIKPGTIDIALLLPQLTIQLSDIKVGR